MTLGLALIVGSLGGAGSACEPMACLERIAAKAAVYAPALPESSVSGHWSRGAGLSGSELYMFPDGTYIYTEWTDVEPETIYDKGRWVLSEALLTLSLR